MGMQAGRLGDTRYTNWVKDSLALLYTKECLEVIVDRRSAVFHRQLMTAVGNNLTCTCSWQALDTDRRRQKWVVKNCPGVCQIWLDLIISHHCHRPLPKLATKNTDPSLWPSDVWEVMKLYQPFGCQGHHRAKDADVAALIDLMRDCDHFLPLITNKSLITEVMSIRNRLMHSKDFLVDSGDLSRDLQNMLDFLRSLAAVIGPQSLSVDESQAVQEAIKKIEELRTNILDLNLNRELELKALKAKQVALETDMKTLEHIIIDARADTATVKSDLTIEVQTLQQRLDSHLSMIRDVERDMSGQQQSTSDVVDNLTQLQQQFDILKRELDETQRNATALKQQMSSLEMTNQQQEATISTLYQRQQVTDTRLHNQQQESQAHASQLEEHRADIATHTTQLADHEARLQAQETHRESNTKILQCHEAKMDRLESKQARTHREEITDADIIAVQQFLVKHYKATCLTVPNPVVPEELGIDHLYVDPDIKVLRETTDPSSGLKSVQDKKTIDKTLQYRRLFYTEDYACKQIYITGDAGKGKSMFCKQLVNLWCKRQNGEGEEPTDIDIDCDFKDLLRSRSRLKQYFRYLEINLLNVDLRTYLLPLLDDTMFRTIKFSDMQILEREMMEDDFVNVIGRDLYQEYLLVKDQKRNEQEDRNIMSGFKLLFYLTLRDSSNLYQLSDMIDSQILQYNQDSQIRASDLLEREQCLVIIDGLDEWMCPADAKVPHFLNRGIPGKNVINKNNVFLTTTRSWKLDTLGLKSTEVDKHVDLVGLNEHASNQLCSKIIKLLNSLENVNRTVEEFWNELKRKGLSHFHNVPVILTQLICLWFDKQDLGQSQVQLYCSMLEMLLKRAHKNFPEHNSTQSHDTDLVDSLLPWCFSNRQHCLNHQHLLVSLSEVAFAALFDSRRENALVFESSQMRIFNVDGKDVNMCLHSGILSQSRILGKWSISEKKLSFLHKKLQEFLAAIFIANGENAENVTSKIKVICNTLEAVLEMSQVWMFVSGIRTDLALELVTGLMKEVVLKDSGLNQDRQALTLPSQGPTLQRSLQSCIVDFATEASCFCLPLDDIVITRSTFSESLKDLITINVVGLKSAYIDTVNVKTSDVLHESVKGVLSELKQTRCLVKLFFKNPNGTLTDLRPLHHILVHNKDYLICLQLEGITLTTELTTAVCETTKHLTALGLSSISLTHDQLLQLLLAVSQACHMNQLHLSNLNCTDHVLGKRCRPVIDLSGHSQTTMLHLTNMCVQNLSEIARCAKDVSLTYITVEETQLRKFLRLLSTSYSVEVQLEKLTVTGGNVVDLTDLTCNDKINGGYDKIGDTWTIAFKTLSESH